MFQLSSKSLLRTIARLRKSIVEAFARNGVLGCVGHIERFNPALQDMRRRLACGELGTLYQVSNPTAAAVSCTDL